MTDFCTIAIDQGTTSSRVMAFSDAGEIIAQSGQEFPQYFPQPGWVEHNADEIFDSVCASLSSVLESLDHHTPCAVGLTNQRETVVLWERESGAPVAPAIVWQDRRTADYCNALKGEGAEADIIARTGLLLDPYFTATKLRWL
ncbi:MAG: FGGY family carbohydrate kinase, partial [Pseudomonadota bacterium]